MKRKLFISSFVLLFGVVGLGLLSMINAAGNATLSLSPASGSYNQNASFAVSIYENSGSETVNTVDAKLSYDASKLQFVSLSTAGSPFTTCTETNGGSGNVSIVCAKLAGTVTSNQLVGAVTFKALAGSGSTAVSFGANSHIVRSPDAADIWNGVTTGGTYSFTTPTAPPPSTPSTPSTTKPTPTTTKPNTSTSTPQPGTTSTEPVVDTEAAKPVVDGFFVGIKVVDDKNNPAVGQTVRLGEQTAITDHTGIASFANIAAGSYEVEVDTDGGKTLSSISVNENASPADVQLFEVRLKKKTPMLVYLIPPVAILLIGAFLWLRKKRQFKTVNARHFPQQQQQQQQQQAVPKTVDPLDRLIGGHVSQAGETIHPTASITKPEPGDHGKPTLR